MKIKKIKDQIRRDFTAIYECERCGHTEESYGYDDRNFHDNVIPDMKCGSCGMSRNTMGIASERTATKYDEWEVV